MPYTVTDSNGNSVNPTVTADITPVIPTATPDTKSGGFGESVRVSVVSNDQAGSNVVPLVNSTLKLVDAAGAEVTTLTTADGVWTVDNGWLVFGPRKGFYGATNPVTYTVLDENGTATTSTATVTIATPVNVAAPDATEKVYTDGNDHDQPVDQRHPQPRRDLGRRFAHAHRPGHQPAGQDSGSCRGWLVHREPGRHDRFRAGRWLQGRNAENRLRGDR